MLRALVASLCTMAMLTAVAGLPAARATRPVATLPHVSLTTMVRLTVIGGLLRHDHPTRHVSQGALAAGVPGSLPKAAGPQPSGLVTAATPASTCVTTVKKNLLAGGYSTKLLGLTTSGGESAVLKQITADCAAKKPVDQVAVGSLFKAKKPSVDASNFLFWGWFTPAAPASRTLKAAGYGPSPIALSMRYTYSLKPQPTAQVLKDLGFSATQDMQALKDVFSVTAGPNSQILKNVGYPATPNMQALKDVFKTTAGPGSKIIATDGYTAKQNGQALIDVFKTKSADGAKFLTADGYSAKNIGIALHDAFKVDAKGMAQLLKSNGFGANDTSTNLRDLYGKHGPDSAIILAQVGYDAFAIGGAMKTVFTLGSSQTVSALKGAGFIQTKIAQVVTPLFAITVPGDLSIAMFGGPFGPCDVAKGVAAVFTLSGADMTTALQQAFSSATDVATGLSCVMPGFNADYAAQLLQGGGFDASDVTDGLNSVFPSLSAGDMVEALQGATFGADDVAANVNRSFFLTSDQLADALKGGDSNFFSAADIGGAMNNLLTPPKDITHALSAAGFPILDTANVLHSAPFNAIPSDATDWLKNAGYSASDIAKGLGGPFAQNPVQTAGLFLNKFDPEVVAGALVDAFNILAPASIKAMFDANYPVDLVSQAVDKYVKPPTLDDAAAMLHDAGVPNADLGNTLVSYFNAPVADALKAFKPYSSPGELANYLKSKFPLDAADPHNAAMLLRDAGLIATQIAPLLVSVFSVATGGVGGVLLGLFSSDVIDSVVGALSGLIDDIGDLF